MNAHIKKLGFWTTLALIVGNTIGAGIYLIPASLAPYGSLSLLGWLLTTVGAVFLSFMFSGLARQIPRAGGPYAYARKTFGDFVGFEVAWSYWLCTWIGNAGIAIAAVSYLSVFIKPLATIPILGCVAAVGLIWLVTAINALGVRQTALVGLIVTIIKILPLLAIAFCGLFVADIGKVVREAGSNVEFSQLGTILTITLWAFLGIESGTVPADHVVKPEKTIPRATVIGTLLCAVIYILVTFSVFAILPHETLMNSHAPVADAAKNIFGSPAEKIIAIGAMISCIGGLIGWVLLQGQMPAAMAREGLFPTVFARMSSRGVPLFGMLISSVLITVVMSLNYIDGLAKQFTTIITVATLTALIPYLFSGLSYMVLVFAKRQQSSVGEFLRAMLVTAGSLAYSVWAIVGSGLDAGIVGAIALLLGIPVYIYQKLNNRVQLGAIAVAK